MLQRLRFTTIQSGLLLFWALWLSLVAVTNLFDALKQVGALPQWWRLASYNYDLVVQTLGGVGLPAAFAVLLFTCAVIWQFVSAGLFWRAWSAMRRTGNGDAPEVTQAFVVGLALWAAFLLATEATVSYATAGTHKGTLIAQLASLIVVRMNVATERALTHAE